MIQALLRFRSATHTLFGGFEHLCAIGYALHEFRIEVGKTLLIFGSVGLLLFAIAVLLDVLLRNLPWWKKCLERFHSIQYRRLL
jgi:hypothetical protein